MRWVSLTALFLVGCALFIPDYNANKHTWYPEPPQVDVQLIPWGNVCATETDENGERYRPAVILIRVIELPPQVGTVTINGDRVIHFGPSKAFTVTWKAGLGGHRIDTDVGGHRASLGLNVYKCSAPGKL